MRRMSTTQSTLLPAACDDPRTRGFPCQGNHKPGQNRANQYASWTSCSACGLRLVYQGKKGYGGESRQMGPEPHLVRLAMESLAEEIPAQVCTEKIFTGKIMEVKGRLLQMGLTNRMAINLTFQQYVDRLEKLGPMEGVPVPRHLREAAAVRPSNPDEDVEKNTLRSEKEELQMENDALRQKLEKAEEKAEKIKGMMNAAKAKGSPGKAPKVIGKEKKKAPSSPEEVKSWPETVDSSEDEEDGAVKAKDRAKSSAP